MNIQYSIFSRARRCARYSRFRALTPKPFLLGGPNFGRAGFHTIASLARQGRCAGTPSAHQRKAGDESFQACAQRPSGVHVARHRSVACGSWQQSRPRNRTGRQICTDQLPT